MPIREKIAYGLSEAPNALVTYVPLNLSNQVFNMSLHISPTLISLVLGFFRLVDAITDPLVGWWSDRFRSRFGRRRPFMFIGVIGMSIVIPWVFWVEPGDGPLRIMLWFAAVGTLLFFFNTLFNIPYQSLAYEMTPDYHERTRVSAYRSIIAQLMMAGVGWLWYLTQLPLFGSSVTGEVDTLRGAQVVSLVAAGLILLVGFFPVFVCKERYYQHAAAGKAENLFRSFRLTLRNRPFTILLVALVAIQIPAITSGLGGYMLAFFYFDGNQKPAAFITGWMFTAAQIVAFCCVPLLTLLSKHKGKERALRLVLASGTVIGVANYGVYHYAPNAWYVIIPAVVTAPFYTGFFLLMPSMVADVVDYDEWLTGERREGTFAAVVSWLYKLSATLMVALAGPLLDLIGFDASLGGAQGPEVFSRMIWALTVVPLIAVALALIALERYPLGREQMVEIRSELELRRGAVSETV